MPEAIPLLRPRGGGQAFTLPVHQGLRATDSPLAGPGCPSTRLCQGHFSQSQPGTPAMLRTHILQALGAITPDHLKARTTGHLTNESISSHPCRGHHHAPTSWPPPPQQESDGRAHHLPAQRAAPASHLGGHHHTKVGVSLLLTPVPGKPRCPRPRHACHPSRIGARGSTDPTPVTGARGSRTSACGPVGRAIARLGHCPAAAPLSPRPSPGPGPPHPRPPLPPARRRARPAATTATATSILGSPRPRFTNAASAGRRRRREGRLRPPGDAASFT